LNRRSISAVLGALSLAALSHSAGRAQGERWPAAVLLITIDTLRADRLGVYGYRRAHTPAIDALARRGVRFADATAPAALTYPAHVGILAARYPAAFGIRLNGMTPLPPSAVTLAERLENAGYETGAIVASVILDEATNLAQGFDTYDDDMAWGEGRSVALAELQRPAAVVVARAVRWIESRKGRRWFLWVHLYDPHLPYDAPPTYRALTAGRPYDAEVAYVDASLGTLFRAIDPASTIVALTADHGESLGDHGESDHGFFLYDATLRVPLIIAGPDIAAAVVRDQVRTIDVAPTIEALLGLPPRQESDGRSLAALAAGGRGGDPPPAYAESWYPKLHFGWSELRSLRVGEWKYIAAPKPELYDLRVDPGEQKNVIQDRAPVAARLASELARIAAAHQGGEPPKAAPQPDRATLERLQALGYVGSFAPAASTGGGDDPKDRIGDYQRYRGTFNRALGALGRGDAATAATLLKQLLKVNVRAFEAHLSLGNAYALQRRHDAALGEYDAAAQLNPELAAPHFEAAKTLLAQGNAVAAVARCRQGLERDPHSFYGHYTLGVIYLKSGQPISAVVAFRRAVELNGADPRARANLASAALAAGETDLAGTQFEAMIALGHQVAPAQYNLGLIANRRGDRAEAERRFKLALAADPAFKPARDALARAK
jgi:arylsulfatase A-like enzyme/Tfp pilus assembly protein PilF